MARIEERLGHVEIRAPAEARLGGGGALHDEDVPFGPATREWARTWPTEDVWIARRLG